MQYLHFDPGPPQEENHQIYVIVLFCPLPSLFQIYQVAMAGTYMVVHCRTPPLTHMCECVTFHICFPPSSDLIPQRVDTLATESQVSRIWGKVCRLMQNLTSASHCKKLWSAWRARPASDRSVSWSVTPCPPPHISVTLCVTLCPQPHQCHNGCNLTSHQCHMEHGPPSHRDTATHCVDVSKHLCTQLSQMLRCLETTLAPLVGGYNKVTSNSEQGHALSPLGPC